MSMLDEVSVYPTVIEGQRVQPCLNVFSDRTAIALELYGETHGKDVSSTVKFLVLVAKWFRVLNVKRKGIDLRYNDILQAVISSPPDERLNRIENFGIMCLAMACKQDHRVRQLSKDTATAIYNTSIGIVELARHFLDKRKYDYVCLGKFSTNPLEKTFSKFRQGSGGTYFLNTHKVTEKLRILKAKLQMKLNDDWESGLFKSEHLCDDCKYSLDVESSETFNNLSDFEASVSQETKQCLEEMEDTYFYYETYGEYSQKQNRGGLTLTTPPDSVCQWTIFGFIIFNTVKSKVCRKSLVKILENVADHYNFNVRGRNCITLANIFLNNFCRLATPKSR